MNYSRQVKKLVHILHNTQNLNAISDFYVQLGQCITLNNKLITNTLNQNPLVLPDWIYDTRDCDIKNNIVFLIWRRYQTVTDKFDDSKSLLGTKIEQLGIILETMHYVEHIKRLFKKDYDTDFIPYEEYIKKNVDTNGLAHTVNLMKHTLFSSIG